MMRGNAGFGPAPFCLVEIQMQVDTEVEFLSLLHLMHSIETTQPEAARILPLLNTYVLDDSMCFMHALILLVTKCGAQVDVDLSPEQFAAKVSRQQARLFLKSDGTFRLANTGRRKFLVNNCQARDQPRPHSASRSVHRALLSSPIQAHHCRHPMRAAVWSGEAPTALACGVAGERLSLS